MGEGRNGGSVGRGRSVSLQEGGSVGVGRKGGEWELSAGEGKSGGLWEGGEGVW